MSAHADPAELLVLRAGRGAAAHVREHGVRPEDIACMPAAAGGPKGLALIPLDRLLHREWLHSLSSLHLVGASIGAWRVAALAQPDPGPALDALQHTYVRDQNYTERPTAEDISNACRRIARGVTGGGTLRPRPGVSLGIVTARAKGALAGTESKLAFGRAALANAMSRSRLAAHLERVVFANDDSFPGTGFDPFATTTVRLDEANSEDALVASGTIPLLCRPVRDIAGAPPGNYWDGALVDYHLRLPYERITRTGPRRRLVLYPHFNDYVTPGWLDKHLPWRVRERGHPWLEDMLLVAPSQAMLDRLPNRKLPDRKDFYRYGPDHASRIRDWERAIGECGRFAEAVMNWLARPDATLLKPL